VLAGAGVAYAALNTYQAGLSFTAKGGTPTKPVATGYTETLGAKNTTSGDRAGVLTDIKTTIYGLKADTKDFPTCSSTTILTGPKFNGNCPKASLIATGVVNAQIGGCPSTSPGCADPLAGNGAPCNPDLAVYNGGGGEEWFFFTTHSATQCAGLKTGATAPYPGKISYKGKNMVIDVPLPPDVSTQVANTPGVYGSLTKETLKVLTSKAKVHGKTVWSLESIGCMHGKRPWSVSFTAVAKAGAPKQTVTNSGSAKC
jgi:hypothetical protein